MLTGQRDWAIRASIHFYLWGEVALNRLMLFASLETKNFWESSVEFASKLNSPPWSNARPPKIPRWGIARHPQLPESLFRTHQNRDKMRQNNEDLVIFPDLPSDFEDSVALIDVYTVALPGFRIKLSGNTSSHHPSEFSSWVPDLWITDLFKQSLGLRSISLIQMETPLKSAAPSRSSMNSKRFESILYGTKTKVIM